MPDHSLNNTILETVLREAMGLNISSVGPSSIKHAIARRMRTLEMDNTLKYLNLLRSSTLELNELIEEVAVNETWFFRDEAPFDALHDFATAFFKHGRGQTLKLLSIPCSTGEEPYSMAISLIEAGIPSHCFTIDAVDISRRSLAIAAQGVYRSHSFRGPQAQRHQSYFTKTRQGYILDKTIKDLVRFHRGNLIHLSRSLTATTYQVIFCRNLLIYLDAGFHQQAIQTFDSLLDEHGLLFIGHAEAGIFSGSRFTPAPYPRAFAFGKRPKEEGPATPPPYPVVHVTDQAEPPLADPLSFAADLPAVVVAPAATEPRPTVSRPAPHDRLDHEIRAYEEIVRKSGPSAESFYRLATLFEQRQDWPTAIKMLKKAVYLDPNSIEAIDMLAAIYQRLGDEANYQATLNRGRRILNRLTMPTNKPTEP